MKGSSLPNLEAAKQSTSSRSTGQTFPQIDLIIEYVNWYSTQEISIKILLMVQYSPFQAGFDWSFIRHLFTFFLYLDRNPVVSAAPSTIQA